MARQNRKWLLALALGVATTVPAIADPAGPDGSKFDNERLEPGLYPVAPGTFELSSPAEAAHPPFDLDWSVGLKGTYTSSSRDGGSFLTTLNPQFSAVHDGVRTDFTVEGSAEIARGWEDGAPIEIPSLRLGLQASTALDSVTRLTGNAAIGFNRELVSAPGLDPLIILPPETLTGSAGVGLERSFGRFNLSLAGDVARTIYGETTRSDTGITDNSSQNVWSADGSLRLGFQATPIFEVFGEAGIGRDYFDMASTNLGVRTDATSRTLRGGIAGSWNGILSASASLGVGQHDFDDAGLADISTELYDASISFTPDPTLNLTAALSTTIEPTGADTLGTARVQHTATASLGYTVNSWLRLRASADWSMSLLEGNGETEKRNGIGAGADYAVNAHTALSADYAYAHRNNSSTGLLDTHRVSVGISLKR